MASDAGQASLNEKFVRIEWMDWELAVPLAQLEPTDASDDTRGAIADWHYWSG